MCPTMLPDFPPMPKKNVRGHPLWQFDRRQLRTSNCPAMVGVDEAGRGALAGPVVAAAAYIPTATYEHRKFRRGSRAINDSKQLKPEQRDEQFSLVQAWRVEGLVIVAPGFASVREIEELNILGATRLAMQRALAELNVACLSSDVVLEEDLFQPASDPSDYPQMLVDGRPLKPFPWRHEGVVGGDGKSLAIAMASIVAKVTRDRHMIALHEDFADYGFYQHKGYGAPMHLAALRRYGPSREHRPTFLRKLLADQRETQPSNLL